MLSVRQLDVGRAGRAALSGLAFEAKAGELVAVVGPSGAGKSTLLSTLTGELPALAGDVLLEGRSVPRWPRQERARRLALLPQESHVAFSFSALEVVQLGRAPWASVPTCPPDATVALEALRRAGVAHLAHRACHALSGGERQRVHLARVLAQLWCEPPGSPGVLLLDEPTSSLDIAAQHTTIDTVLAFARSGGAVVATMHDLNLAAQYADRVLVVAGGRQIAFGPAAEVLTEDVVREAFGWPVRVVPHPELDRPLVVARRSAAR